MLRIRLDSGVPLADQVEQGIRAAIARDEVKPGDALPTVRQLAADLGIHMNTVARAYRALEAAGLVAAVRGRGTVVRSAREPAPPRERLAARLRGLLADLRLAGLDRRAVERMVRAEMRPLWR